MRITSGKSSQKAAPCYFCLLLVMSLTTIAAEPPNSQTKRSTPPWYAGSPFFLVDLSRHVNVTFYDSQMNDPGNNLAGLIDGLVTNGIPVKFLKKIPFRLDGVVLVGRAHAGNPRRSGVFLPGKVEDIPIAQRAQRLHFLHSMHYGQNVTSTRVGAYVVHFADGSWVEIPIVFGEDVLDWWGRTVDMFPYDNRPARSGDNGRLIPGALPTEDQGSRALARVAWRGSNAAAREHGYDHIRLFIKSWKNPYPEKEIASFDMLIGDQPDGSMSPAPFLVALTGELDPEFHTRKDKMPPNMKKRLPQ